MLKYHNRKGLAENLGAVLYARILPEYIDLLQFSHFKDPVLVPAPLSKKRYKERGYNQSELLARGILRADSDQIFSLDTTLVEKIHHTKNQAGITNRSIRLRNLSGAFQVTNPARVAGKNIILIDDVTTTGATLAELRKVLQQAGAKKVIAFTVAH
jgi:competence protein ComFC